MLSAQSLSWEDFVDLFTSELSDTEDAPATFAESALEELYAIHLHPFNLNTLTGEDLRELPFLSARQADDLLTYATKHRPIYSPGELQLVPSVDYATRRLLSLFIYCGEAPVRAPAPDTLSLARRLTAGKTELTTRADLPLFYQRAGYLKEDPAKGYLGSALHASLRYRYTYKNRLFYGLTAEKDAGEPFAAAGNRLFDSYSFYLYADKGRGALRTWALGDYRLNLEQGLIIGSGFFSNGQTLLTWRQSAGALIRRHSSTDETNFLRGAAASLRWHNLTLTSFASLRRLDATLRSDGSVSSLKTDGYHRTASEYAKKNNTQNGTFGGHLAWETGKFHAGLTGLYTRYNRQLAPSEQLYRRYYPRGDTFYAGSLGYGYQGQRFSFAGETATAQSGGIAMLHTLRWAVMDRFRLTLSERFYSYRFVAPHSFAYHTGHAVQNEQGIYAGVDWRVKNNWSVSSYADLAYYPWATFRCQQHSSYTHHFFLQSQSRISYNNSLLLRYRYNDYQEDGNAADVLRRIGRHQVKAQIEITKEAWTWTGAANGVVVTSPDSRARYGWLLACRATHRQKGSRLSGFLAYFHTDDYATRLTQSEPNLLYAPTTSTFYYHGWRAVLLGSFTFRKQWELTGKLGFTAYTNRTSISTGLGLIDAPTKQDISLQLRWIIPQTKSQQNSKR